MHGTTIKISGSKFPKIIKMKLQVITKFKSNKFTPKKCRYLQHNCLSTLMRLSQPEVFKNSVPLEIGLCIRTYLRTAVSASSLLRTRPTPERCSSEPSKWHFAVRCFSMILQPHMANGGHKNCCCLLAGKCARVHPIVYFVYCPYIWYTLRDN
jgi:hypothetical protein